MYEYESLRRVQYEGGATFVPVCKTCGRFVRADETMRLEAVGEGYAAHAIPHEPNADCSKCGRTGMLFEGFMEGE